MAKKLVIENLMKSYGEKVLFDGLSLTIEENDRIGLIGINGTGKSTLLKIIAGLDTPDLGDMIPSKDYQIAYLWQAPAVEEEVTVLEQLFSGNSPSLNTQRKYEQALIELTQNPESNQAQNALFAVQQEMDAINAWDANVALKAMLGKLGIDDLTKKMKELSGGQKKRVAMASILAQNPDLLILDEPTNHLDHDTIEWLENYLSRYNGALLFVTHDRYFLDRITNRILELDDGNLYTYTGNYSTFLEAKALRTEMALATETKNQNLFRRELAWIRRGAQARSTKQKARIDRFETLKDRKKPKATENVDISLGTTRIGKKVLDIQHLSKAFGPKILLSDFTYIVAPDARIGIVGKNGSGKSTLLNMLAGKIAPDNGTIETGETIKLAYYTQETEEMDLNQRLIAYIRDVAEVVHTTDGKTISASQMLERFLFPNYMHGLPISKLSGGERRRLFLLKLLMSEPNLLFLDEPTNDLDTQTLTILEDYLETFAGAIITVSHDRYFLDKVVDELIVLNEDGKTHTHIGAYTEFLQKQKNSELTTEPKPSAKPTEKPKQPKKKLSFHEQKEWDTIEDEIAELETTLTAAQTAMAATGSDYIKAGELQLEIDDLETQLMTKMTRWEELSELVESFG